MQLKAGMLQSEAADNGMMQPGGAVTQPPLCDGRRLTAVDRTRARTRAAKLAVKRIDPYDRLSAAEKVRCTTRVRVCLSFSPLLLLGQLWSDLIDLTLALPLPPLPLPLCTPSAATGGAKAG